MSFSASTIHELSKGIENQVSVDFLSTSQKITAGIDFLGIIAIIILSGLVFADYIPGLSNMTNTVGYSLLGGAAFFILADFTFFTIQAYKKFQKQLAGNKPIINIDSAKLQPSEILQKKTEAQTTTESLQKQLDDNKKTAETQKNEFQNKIAFLEQQLAKQQKQLSAIDKNLEATKDQPSAKVKLAIEDSKKGTPFIEGDKLYINSVQADQIKAEPYFKKFLSGDFESSIEETQEFLHNLTVFLNKNFYKISVKAEQLGSERLEQECAHCVKHSFKDFFAEIGLSKDAAFIHHSGDVISEGAQTVFNNLIFANKMQNKALMEFWIQVLKKHMPFVECIDSFSNIANMPIQNIHQIHEILFETLLSNPNKPETLQFLKTHKNSSLFKINKLNLDLLLELVHETDTPQRFDANNIEKINLFLSLVDLKSVKILERHTDRGVTNELRHIFNVCTSFTCVSHGSEVTGRSIAHLSELEEKAEIIDLTKYQFHTDFVERDTHIFFTKSFPSEDLDVQILYLKGKQEEAEKYLNTHYGISMKG